MISEPKKVKEIVRSWLTQNGYEGLSNGYIECGCTLDNLMPCEESCEHCEASHRGKPPEGEEGDDWMYPGKKGGGA